ncbi:MAG TPA: cytochrome d ubiquinol oxidase subunit II, partial [Candidatus Aminicenantes bacterium]|nr:cytochrome d ubiquinol oxidase subunit II [Candidatus Aminicenantes bacterium]
FFTLLRPYPLAIGGLGLCAILLQGATFAALKTEGTVRERAQGIAAWMPIPLLVLLAVTGFMGYRLTPAVFVRWTAWLSCLGVVLGAVLAMAASRRGQDVPAFAGSCVAFAGLWGIAGAVLYPDLLRSLGPGPALTVFNSAAGEKTLLTMTVIALIGVPLVLGYTVYAYRTFRGRTSVPAVPPPEEP